jgi:hypothetical protein
MDRSVRHAAVTASPSPHVSLFLRNLHLLDLDLHPDWPNINPQTFSAKDASQTQRQRVKGMEWTIYQLFSIWDPEETNNVRDYDISHLLPAADQYCFTETTSLLSPSGTTAINQPASSSVSMFVRPEE